MKQFRLPEMTFEGQSTSLMMDGTIHQAAYHFLLVVCSKGVYFALEIWVRGSFKVSENGRIFRQICYFLLVYARGHSPCEFKHDLYIAEIYRLGVVLLPVMLVYLYSFLRSEPQRYGRSRSFKVIEIGSNRKPICDFLLVFHCNYMPISYRSGRPSLARWP